MSKEDAIKRTIMKLTRCRSFGKATQGWEFLHAIELSRSEPAVTCRLCGTSFRKGAMMRHSPNGRTRGVEITVGGTCVETIRRGSFPDRKATSQQRKEVSEKIHAAYGALNVDSGTWVNWLIQHVPKRLQPLAAQLRFVGTVPTERDLKRLIAFHDGNCRYSTMALLPSFPREEVAHLPEHITLNVARAFLKGLTDERWEQLIFQRAKLYQESCVDEIMKDDDHAHEAWRRLDQMGKRAVVALMKVSEFGLEQDNPAWNRLTSELKRLVTPIPPVFAWNSRRGLGLIYELSTESDDEAEVWLLPSGECEIASLDDWTSVYPKSSESLVALERQAFWENPPWSQGKPTRSLQDSTSRRRVIREPVKSAAQIETDEIEALKLLPCVQACLEIAGFRARDSSFSWIKRQLIQAGLEWESFSYGAKRYESHPDCREQIDCFLRRLSSRA